MLVALYSYTCQSGKDTVAGFIRDWCDRLGVSYANCGLADQMKIVCADALGIAGSDEAKIAEIDRIKNSGLGGIYYQRKDSAGHLVTYSTGQTGRDFIISVAESIRRLDPDFWIRHGMPPAADVRVLTDVRFQPEVDAVRLQAEPSFVVEVVRPDTQHVNEDRIPTVDWVLRNDDTLDMLHLRTYEMMDHFYVAC